MRTPRLRRYKRIWRLVYPLSATIRLGRMRGRPLPTRLTAPLSISCLNIVTSCCWPGVSANVTGLPAPSHLTCILVENPPWLRPKASFRGSPLLHRLRAGEHVRLCYLRSGRPTCYLRSGRPTLSSLRHRPAAVARQVFGPTLLPLASGRSEKITSSRSRSVQASPAREHRSVLSRVCHSALSVGRCRVDLLSVFAVGAAASAVPTVHQLAHVFVP
jgi:hypothetical protein